MIEEVTFYKATDGTMFEDENACIEYEIKQSYGDIFNRILFFDFNKNAISIEDLLADRKSAYITVIKSFSSEDYYTIKDIVEMYKNTNSHYFIGNIFTLYLSEEKFKEGKSYILIYDEDEDYWTDWRKLKAQMADFIESITIPATKEYL